VPPDTESIGPPPKGFSFARDPDGSWTVQYKRRGMGCMVLFLIVWLSGWTAAVAVLLYAAITRPSALSIGFLALFLAAELLVAAHLAPVLWGRVVLRFTGDRLTVETVLFRRRTVRELSRQDVRAVRRIKDGGKGEDSFPSWGLVVDTEAGGKPISILDRQSIDKSAWLGPLVALWSGKPYIESEEQE